MRGMRVAAKFHREQSQSKIHLCRINARNCMSRLQQSGALKYASCTAELNSDHRSAYFQEKAANVSLQLAGRSLSICRHTVRSTDQTSIRQAQRAPAKDRRSHRHHIVRCPRRHTRPLHARTISPTQAMFHSIGIFSGSHGSLLKISKGFKRRHFDQPSQPDQKTPKGNFAVARTGLRKTNWRGKKTGSTERAAISTAIGIVDQSSQMPQTRLTSPSPDPWRPRKRR
jgi:hypothetical protein